ncbi:MAG TPA: DCC1-like thiol-disulfide oxidoreductase family protein [Burkholderiales bacterium]
MNNQWTGRQYGVFRGLLGAYLAVHFLHLMPWGGEVFSSAGMLAEAHASPLFALFPSVLHLSDAPWMIAALIGLGAAASVLLAFGVQDRPAALLAWYVLACLFTRNPLIANPALPYLGWMLLAHLFVPRPGMHWRVPREIFLAAWIVLALSYSYSGYTKLLSPSWISGDTVSFVLQNPLARDHFLRDWALSMPEGVLRALTWGILYVELLFAPLALSRRLRPLLWGAMLIVQLGFLLLLNFPDLTVPMLLFHLLTFDPEWLAGRQARAGETIFYDGTCGLCHGVVRFVLSEDTKAGFRFAPLQGRHFEALVPQAVRSRLPETFVVLTDEGRLLLKSDAVIHLLLRLGGLWRLAGSALGALPRPVRDAAYDAVGANRQRLFRRPEGLCPLVPATLRERFSD